VRCAPTAANIAANIAAIPFMPQPRSDD